MPLLQHHVYQKTVQDLIHLYQRDLLNLSPGFQRDSVWTDRDRGKLIDSILRGWPLPAIFLYRRQADGEIVYDVIDGKQRIESILRFTGAIRGERFGTRVQLPGVVLMSKFDAQNLILTDRRRNKLAWDLLVALSNGVDDLKARQKKLMTQRGEVELYRDYLLTVLEGTDEISKRQRREEILRGLLENLFRRRDSERLFSPEQRRVLWNTSDDRRCAICREPVWWGDLTIDHINPFSKGGRTSLKNAALAHRRCNSRKGARSGRRTGR